MNFNVCIRVLSVCACVGCCELCALARIGREVDER